MTTDRHATHTTGGSRLALIGGTMLTLAALASVVGWSVTTDPSGTASALVTTSRPTHPITAVSDERTAATEVAATTDRPSAIATGRPAPTFLYLVATPEEAALLRQFLADLNGLRRELGQAPHHDMVAETTLAADAAAALPRPPGSTVYDLR